MWFWDMIMLIGGLGALIKGADLLVQKSVVLSKYFSLSPFFVGVVLLGMGTSAPEAAVSALSSLKGLSQLAVGNVFGSNIFNILLVLGMILFQPLSLKEITSRKKDIWFLVLTGFTLAPLMWDLFLSRLEALFLSLLFFSYMFLSYFSGKKEEKLPAGDIPSPLPPNFKNQAKNNISSSFSTEKQSLNHTLSNKLSLIKTKTSIDLKVMFAWLILGFLLLVGGSQLTVIGAEELGRKWGISERILGLLVVSVGTSLPEFVASLTALIKGHKDMAIGNIIGSNVFNTFAILSLAVWIKPATLNIKMLALDLPALWITHLLLLVLLFGYRSNWVKKVLPFVFLLSYGVFLLILFFYPHVGGDKG